MTLRERDGLAAVFLASGRAAEAASAVTEIQSTFAHKRGSGVWSDADGR
jgi:hypothetical protein